MAKKISQDRAEMTKAAILKAARKLFAEYGYAGTSIGKIAALADINHSLIFHHFINKQGLWVAVKQSIVDESNDHSPVLPKLDQPFASFLHKLFTQSIAFYKNNRDITRMINWQRLANEDEQSIGITASNETLQWLAAIKHYQKAGEINTKLKPEFILSMILSLVSSTALDPNIFIRSKDAQQAYISFCIDLMLKALHK